MITNIILGVIVPLILLVVGGYLMLTYRDERILRWVNVAVKAAEQIYNSIKRRTREYELRNT